MQSAELEQLSELARQIYAILVERLTSPAAERGYVALGELEFTTKRNLAHYATDPEGQQAIDQLISIGLVEEAPFIASRYKLTARSWQRILAERSVERDRAVDALTLSVEVVRALLRVNNGKPLGDELRGLIMQASEAAAQVLPSSSPSEE